MKSRLGQQAGLQEYDEICTVTPAKRDQNELGDSKNEVGPRIVIFMNSLPPELENEIIRLLSNIGPRDWNEAGSSVPVPTFGHIPLLNKEAAHIWMIDVPRRYC